MKFKNQLVCSIANIFAIITVCSALPINVASMSESFIISTIHNNWVFFDIFAAQLLLQLSNVNCLSNKENKLHKFIALFKL